MDLDEQDALFANEAFYLAFSQKDVDAMESLWATTQPLVCVHPGWERLTDRDEIIASWQQILRNPRQPGMDFHHAVASSYGSLVLITCYEQLPGGICLATNGFVAEQGAARMVLHHSGACAHPPDGIRLPE